MSPVAPMPQGAPVGTNGLKVWVMVDSGELSMTSCLPVVAAPVVELEPAALDPLDAHAASPAASRPAAPTAKSRLWLFNLLITLVFLSCSALGFGYPVVRPPPGSCGTSSGAATSRRQQAAPRVAVMGRRTGSSCRQRSSANGHRGLNGQPTFATCSAAGGRRAPCGPGRRVPLPPARSV